MILKLLLTIHMIWMIFIKILNTTQRKSKILILPDDMIADMLSNKNLNSVVTGLFIKNAKHFFCFYCKILFCCAKKY